ncbi:hypothetical protein [Streptomyces sp. NPDC055912]|uniref:hypothetical protein n=1 Tax=Streptomyces sp. NPDC055912 TaxID=3345660 RepID=UPI0035E0BC75
MLATELIVLEGEDIHHPGRGVQLGCYVLTTMAMQSLLRGFGSEAVDMAQGAFERAKGQAAHQRAAAMPSGVFTRSVGMRLAIVGTAHLQARNLDQGLELGNQSVDILARVQSSRAKDYVREFNTALAPWRREPAIREFIHRTRTELSIAA